MYVRASGVFKAAVYEFLIRFKIQNGGFKMVVTKMKTAIILVNI